MKTLIFSKKIALTLCAVFAMMFVFSSCGKNDVADVNNLEAQHQIENFVLPEGNLKNTIDIRDENIGSRNGESVGGLIELSTNNEEIFALLNVENFKANLVTREQVAETVEERDTEDINILSSDESEPNTSEHFLTIKLLEESAEDGEAVDYTLSDELLEVLKKYKAQTHIQLYTENKESIDDRSWRTVFRNAFKLKGANSVVVQILYDNCGGPMREVRTGVYNGKKVFKTCTIPGLSFPIKDFMYVKIEQGTISGFSRFMTSDCDSCYF